LSASEHFPRIQWFQGKEKNIAWPQPQRKEFSLKGKNDFDTNLFSKQMHKICLFAQNGQISQRCIKIDACVGVGSACVILMLGKHDFEMGRVNPELLTHSHLCQGNMHFLKDQRSLH